MKKLAVVIVIALALTQLAVSAIPETVDTNNALNARMVKAGA